MGLAHDEYVGVYANSTLFAAAHSPTRESSLKTPADQTLGRGRMYWPPEAYECGTHLLHRRPEFRRCKG